MVSAGSIPARTIERETFWKPGVRVHVYTVKVCENGDVFWYNAEGDLHRVDGPAVDWASGSKEWHRDGKRHREDGPAVEGADGSKEWYVDGKRHRVDGPAIEEADGYKAWFRDGKRHREDGPAVELANGIKWWYLDGETFSEAEFNARIIEKSRPCVGKTVVVDGVEYTLT